MKTFRTLPAAIEQNARLRPDSVALVCWRTGARTTYAELSARCGRIAGSLEKMGVGRGDRVAILAHNSPRILEMMVACARLGAAIAPLNVRLSDLELDVVLSKCKARVVFVDEAHAARVPGRPLEDVALLVAEPAPDRGADEDPLVVLFTSGTTGLPKGAVLPQRSIAANASSTARAWEITENDVGLVDAPMFHTGGLNVLATPLLYAGGTVVIAPRFDAADSSAAIAREGVTIAFGVPQMLDRLLATSIVDRNVVRLWVTGGAPCPRALIDAFADRDARLVQGFGMTECGPNCFRPLAGVDATSVGVPTFDLEARIDAPPGEPGELLLRGPHVFSGYLGDEEATRAAMPDGWLRTGDVLRATNAGWYVVGRKKEMFISGGENVYPAEVERALHDHPSVREAAVVGVPDETWGEAGVAFVVVLEGATVPGEGTFRAFLRDRIARYKVPKRFVVMRELPRTPSGKIDKRALSGPR